MLDIIHFKQIISCFQESNDILSNISDFDSSYKIIKPDSLNCADLWYYYYDTNQGFYSCMREKSDEIICIYGKTKRDIIFKLVDNSIRNEALSFAYNEYKAICKKKNIDYMSDKDLYAEYFNLYAQQRIAYCHSIVDKYIEKYNENH